ncbi:MAG: A24 family peptidase [Mycobacterium sp.]|nr:A24 family peptidase [Mycobacterium sp.]
MAVLKTLCGGAVLAWALALVVVDLTQRRLPNLLTVPGAVVILLGATACGQGASALLGAAVLGSVYLVVHLVDPAGLGGGDVKLAVALGALTGALGSAVWVLAALAAPVFTAVAGTVAALCRRGRVVPHGPSMCVASLLAAAPAVL